MKLVVRVRLYPDAAQEAALRETLMLCNRAANIASVMAYEAQVSRPMVVQRLVYATMKGMGLSAQPAIHVARKVAGAYATLQAKISAGRLGRAGSPQRVAAESKPVRFRRDAAQPFDDRCLSWRMDDQTVSIWTVHGRCRSIRFGCSKAQLVMLRAHRKGQSDLIRRDGKWFLYACADVPEGIHCRREPASWGSILALPPSPPSRTGASGAARI